MYDQDTEKNVVKDVAQRSCRHPILGSAQGEVGWGFEQACFVESVPAHRRGTGTR